MRAWLNGQLLPIEAVAIAPSDRGFLLGDGVFETIRIQNGFAVDLAAHLRRLAAGLSVLGFEPQLDGQTLARDLVGFVAAEALDKATLRLTVTRGSGPRGLAPPPNPSPTVLMTWAPAAPPRAGPVRLLVAQSTRRNEFSPVSNIKALPYLDNLIALREAHARGAEEAIMLNTRGNVACASIANVFIVEGERLVTPPLDEGALPGTMRARALAAAPRAHLVALEEPITLRRLASADAIFLTNSIRGVVLGTLGVGHAEQAVAALVVGALRDVVEREIADAMGEGDRAGATSA